MTTKFGRKNLWLKHNAYPGSKVMQGSAGPEVKLPRNALWLPNLVGRIPDQSIMHCWGQRYAEVNWGQPEVKLLDNALWLPNLVGRISDKRVMHCWGQRSCRCPLGSTRGQITLKCPMASKFGRKNSRPEHTALIKGHIGVSQDQPEVTFLGV